MGDKGARMARKPIMMRLAKWHIWLGWLIGVPLLMWTLTGLVMVARPIDQVRGEHLRAEVTERALPPQLALPAIPDGQPRPVEITIRYGDSGPVALARFADGSLRRFSAESGALLPELSASDARAVLAGRIVTDSPLKELRKFDADEPPFDFRRPVDVWRGEYEDGTRVYIGRQSGAVEAVRTPFWRLFDFMWGLHIMDLQTREDTSHPILIAFAALGAIGSLMGIVLLFRRRRSKRRARN
ncbi:MAG: hypothetical protein CL802_04830 [Citromicrobium sp.]|nr:hypothetical protein [Citromicrobium sp.]|tara:strand:- start:1145 stop:1867 length:723 start_codon:yes stop_codon:yes gene_type:complete